MLYALYKEKPIATRKCDNCGTHADLLCSRCSESVYCSLSCQSAHWERHRASCFPRSYPISMSSTTAQGLTTKSLPLLPPPCTGNRDVIDGAIGGILDYYDPKTKERDGVQRALHASRQRMAELYREGHTQQVVELALLCDGRGEDVLGAVLDWLLLAKITRERKYYAKLIEMMDVVGLGEKTDAVMRLCAAVALVAEMFDDGKRAERFQNAFTSRSVALYGNDSLEAADAYTLSAATHYKHNRFNQALRFASCAKRIREEQLNSHATSLRAPNVYTAYAAMNTGLALMKLQRFQQAAATFLEAFLQFRRLLGLRERVTIESRYLHAQALFDGGNKADALSALSDVVQANKQTLGKDHPETQRVAGLVLQWEQALHNRSLYKQLYGSNNMDDMITTAIIPNTSPWGIYAVTSEISSATTLYGETAIPTLYPLLNKNGELDTNAAKLLMRWGIDPPIIEHGTLLWGSTPIPDVPPVLPLYLDARHGEQILFPNPACAPGADDNWGKGVELVRVDKKNVGLIDVHGRQIAKFMCRRGVVEKKVQRKLASSSSKSGSRKK